MLEAKIQGEIWFFWFSHFFHVDLLNSTIGYFNCWSYLAIISKRILEDFSSLATSKCEAIKANPKHGQHPLQHRSVSEN